MELDACSTHYGYSGGLAFTPVNKVHHVHTIARVAEMLGEDEDWLSDVANEMDPEDGLIWFTGQAMMPSWRSPTLASKRSPT